MLKAAITIDTDTLEVHFQGLGLKRKNYTYLEYEQGMENLSKLLNEFGIKATFFIIGKDLYYSKNISILREIINEGHEIASHSMNHFQGFRFLKREEKIKELSNAEEILFKFFKKKPVGFRAPGWNIDDETLELLVERGYLYDSSIFPSFFNPVLKILHYITTSSCSHYERTTLGEIKYILSSPRPYYWNNRLIEFPVSVTPIFRIPFFATFLLATGLEVFKVCFKLIKLFQRPIIYLFHLLDFVDFQHPEFKDQIPWGYKGIYIPASITTPFKKSMMFLEKH